MAVTTSATSSKRASYPGRVIGGVTGAILLCLWGAFAFYDSEEALQLQSDDPYLVSAQKARFAGMLAVVPENAVLGYLTDEAPGSLAESTMFLTAQYTLAPRLLDRGAAPEWVLGNFRRRADFAAIGQAHSLLLQQDFGDGVVLYRRAR
jgi:hypothetical protein